MCWWRAKKRASWKKLNTKCSPCFPQSYHQKSINIQQSFRLGRHATLSRKRLISIVNRNLNKAVYKKEDFKRWDRRRSFSNSLVFIRQFWNRVEIHEQRGESLIINWGAEIYSRRNSTGRRDVINPFTPGTFTCDNPPIPWQFSVVNKCTR